MTKRIKAFLHSVACWFLQRTSTGSQVRGSCQRRQQEQRSVFISDRLDTLSDRVQRLFEGEQNVRGFSHCSQIQAAFDLQQNFTIDILNSSIAANHAWMADADELRVHVLCNWNLRARSDLASSARDA